MKREHSTEIDAAAARWTARIDRAPLGPEEQRELESWAAADPRRLGAFARAQAVLAHTDRARGLGPEFNAHRAIPARPSRRSLLGGLLAAGVACLSIFGGWLYTHPGDLRTAKGEVRLVPLPDGSSVTLNTASVVHVDFNESVRNVELVEGEALFEVAKDRARPFVVHAGDTQVRAVGTSFTVRRLSGDSVRVVVREGVVEVVRAGAAMPPVRAAANVGVTAEPSHAMDTVAVPPAEMSRELAWREGMLSFDGITIQAAADEFARYSDTRIVIDDPALALETVTGLFSANDPRGFAKAVGRAFGAGVTISGEEIHLSR